MQCRLPDRSRARPGGGQLPTRPAARPPADSVTDDDDRRQPVKQYWPIRQASNNTITAYYKASVRCEFITQLTAKFCCSLHCHITLDYRYTKITTSCSCFLEIRMYCTGLHQKMWSPGDHQSRPCIIAHLWPLSTDGQAAATNHLTLKNTFHQSSSTCCSEKHINIIRWK